jgi:hypothetical protein
MSDETAVAAAMRQAEGDAQRRQDYYQQHPPGVPAGSTGEPVNVPLPLPDDPAVTGVQGGVG